VSGPRTIAPAGAPGAGALRGAAERPRRWGAWYVTEHKLRALRAFGGGMFANALFNPILTLYTFGVGLGSLIASATGPTAIDGVSYLAFVMPAMLCGALLMVGAEEGWFTFLSGFKWNEIFAAMRSAPISSAQVVDGIVMSIVIRLLATGAIYYLIGLLFGAVHPGWSLLMIPIGALSALALCLPVAAIACATYNDRGQHNIIMRLVVSPMMLFAGTMYPLTTLPIWLQWVGWISPLWHASQLSRAVSYGIDEPAWLIVVHWVVLLVPAAIGWRLAVRNATRRLQK